jgi:hypothetical protein
MALTLITGLPGHGKTLYTLWRFKAEAEKSGRPVFQCSGEADAAARKSGALKGIPALQLPWPVIDPLKWWEAPPNSIVIIDEAQFVFPMRGRGEPPEYVARLATHRHLGIDLVLVTQGPMLLDSFVRDLVDRHFDVVRKFGTHFATVHEFANGCRPNVRKARGKDSIRHEWRYPREVFTWYKSAEAHTVKTRIPMRVWLLFAMPVVFLALAWLAYSRLNPQAMTERTAKAAGVPVAGVASPPTGSTHQRPADGPHGLSAREYADAYVPRVAGLPHTAPVYDEVVKPTEAPYPAACIASASRCVCSSQQGTRLDTPDDLCRSIAQGGFFVSWRLPVAHAIPMVQPAGQVSQAQAAPVVAGINAGGYGLEQRQTPLAESTIDPAPAQGAGRKPPKRS